MELGCCRLWMIQRLTTEQTNQLGRSFFRPAFLLGGGHSPGLGFSTTA